MAVVALCFAVTVSGSSQRSTAPPRAADTQADVTRRIVTAANAVLATLDGAGRAKVQFPSDGPQKTRWS
jgi:hypothetical protein